MQTYFLIAATLLYLVCGFLPSRKAVPIAALTAGAWLLHGAALWVDVMLPGSLRVGFATMLSSALWISVGAYWLENQNYTLDGLRRIVLPVAGITEPGKPACSATASAATGMTMRRKPSSG